MSKTNDGTTRRDVLKLAAGGAAVAATNGLLLPSTAQAANKLKLMNLGFLRTHSIHMPGLGGMLCSFSFQRWSCSHSFTQSFPLSTQLARCYGI